MAFLDFAFRRRDFSRPKSLLVCEKVNYNKMLLYLFETYIDTTLCTRPFSVRRYHKFVQLLSKKKYFDEKL